MPDHLERDTTAAAAPPVAVSGPTAGDLYARLRTDRVGSSRGGAPESTDRHADLARSLRSTATTTMVAAVLLWGFNFAHAPVWSWLVVPALLLLTGLSVPWARRSMTAWPQRHLTARMALLVLLTQVPLTAAALTAVLT